MITTISNINCTVTININTPWSYQLSSPTAIVLDPYGYIYVLDYGNDRVQKWWPGGAYGTTVAATTLGNAFGLALDTLGNMYVADSSSHRVLKFGLLCRKFNSLVIASRILFFFFIINYSGDNNNNSCTNK